MQVNPRRNHDGFPRPAPISRAVIYLDNCATTALAPEVVDRMTSTRSGPYANASSVHRPGQHVRVALEVSRESIAASIGAEPKELIFTSGGTESNNFALKGYALRQWRLSGRWPAIAVARTEHHAILEPANYLASLGVPLIELSVDRDGRVLPDVLRESLQRVPRDVPSLVSIMHANNETGVINPIADLASVAHEQGAIFHTDAVQTFGKIPTDVRTLGVDMMTISAHKIHGPKGIGALYLSRQCELDPLIHGGSQERNRRGGTEPIELIAGFEQAVALVSDGRREAYAVTMVDLTHRLRQLLNEIAGVHVVTPDRDSLPNVVTITFDDASELDGEGLIVGMDLEGIAVSNGAACTSGSIQPSHVLSAMGLPPAQARAAVRFSLSRYSTFDEVEAAAIALRAVLERMRSMDVARSR